MNPNTIKVLVKNGAKAAVGLAAALVTYEMSLSGVEAIEFKANMIANEIKPGAPVKVKTGPFKTKTVTITPLTGRVQSSDKKPVNNKPIKATGNFKRQVKNAR